VFILGFLPFHFRFWQCIYKYNESGLWHPNLVNAGKYMAGIFNIYFTYLYGLGRISTMFFVSWGVFTTLYSYAWDLVMDWGLLRGQGSNWFLRDKLFYPKWLYYFSVITNFFLRFAWLTPLFITIESKFINDANILFFVLALGELYRRA